MTSTFIPCAMADRDDENVERLQQEKERAELQLRESMHTAQRTRKVLDTLLQDSTCFYMSARLRPFSDAELQRGSYSIVECHPRENKLELLEIRNEGTMKVLFDDIYDSSDPGSVSFASQETVYNRVGRPLLDFAFQGFNATLLGFGQTSSGKTYTLVGDNVDRGIVPRFMTDLFDFIARKQDSNAEQEWKVELDAIEVYNEKIYNLLEGVTSEDAFVAPVPRVPNRSVAPPKARFNRGTFSDIEKDAKARMRPRTKNGNPERSFAATSTRNGPSSTGRGYSATPTAFGGSRPPFGGGARGSQSRSTTPTSTSIRSSAPPSTVSSRASSPSRSGTQSTRGTASSLRSKSSGTGTKDLGASEEDGYPIKGGILVPYYVQNLQPIVVTNVNKMFHLLAITQQNKTVAETRMNRHSSRSHTLYRIYLTRSERGRTIRSTVSLVDLAGSENIKQSNAQGVNATEAISINKSLTVLAHCLSLRAANSKVKPPYNTCALTKLLKETLDGNARTHMVITLSPTDSNLAATQAALRFAQTCKKVKTRPTCNLETDAGVPLQDHINKSIEELQAQLEEEEGRNDELKAKIAELQDFIKEEKRRAEAQAGPANMVLRTFLTSQEKVLMAVESAYFAEEQVFLNSRDQKREARNYYLHEAATLAEQQDAYSYRLEQLDPKDDGAVHKMLSDVFQWSCTTNAAEFMLYRLQLKVVKIERVENDRLRSDFYSCKAGLTVPHSKSLLRFCGGKVDNLDSTLKYGFELPDPKKFNDYGVGLHFSTNATKAALSSGNQSNQLIIAEVALGSTMQPSDAARIGLHALTPELVQRRGYDSVHATCGRTLLEDEYIVFQHRQALPAFVVTYSIEHPQDAVSSKQVTELEAANRSLVAQVESLKKELAHEKEQVLLLKLGGGDGGNQKPPLVSTGVNTDVTSSNSTSLGEGTESPVSYPSSPLVHDMACGPMEDFSSNSGTGTDCAGTSSSTERRRVVTTSSGTDTAGLERKRRKRDCKVM